MEDLTKHYRLKAEQERQRLSQELRAEFWARKQKEAKDVDERF